MAATQENGPPTVGGLSDEPTPQIDATGAWLPGDDPGDRLFADVCADRPFVLEGGGILNQITLAYETWGELNVNADNAVLICHALTGDSHVVGRAGKGHPAAGWWDDLVGPGKAVDTDRYFVVCANSLGGCQGSTGPASINPETGKPYGSTFPIVSTRDIVRTQARLADHLGIAEWMTVIGASMGGMQAVEWSVMFPNRVRSSAFIATTGRASAEQIAWSMVGRRAVIADPRWRGGDYYDAGPGDGPHEGLITARAIAHIHYRSEQIFAERFGREVVGGGHDGFSFEQEFQVERYLNYQGRKLACRFDANSYLILNKVMDLHDIGRGRGGFECALRRVTGPCITMTISTDWLYPPYQQAELRDTLRKVGVKCDHVHIESPHGHDGFLLEIDAIGPPLANFLAEAEKSVLD